MDLICSANALRELLGVLDGNHGCVLSHKAMNNFIYICLHHDFISDICFSAELCLL